MQTNYSRSPTIKLTQKDHSQFIENVNFLFFLYLSSPVKAL